MSSKVAKLVSAYRQHLTVPWQAGLAAIQRVIFAVYDKAMNCACAPMSKSLPWSPSKLASKWLLIDVTNAFPSGWPHRSTAMPISSRPEDLAGYQPAS
jgi:hypothetical protein